MKTKRRIFFSFIFYGNSFLIALPVMAGGFQVNLQGQKQAGMGHTGTALLHGSSSAFFNPGALAFTDSADFSLGSSFIIPRMQYLEPYPGVYKTETVHKTGTPFSLYSSYKPAKSKDFTVGMAVYTLERAVCIAANAAKNYFSSAHFLLSRY
jgi:long-chain fatty acid transport protein